jgi:hypothetical protein
MKSQQIPATPLGLSSATKRYGITESKKAELDALTLQVMDTQHTAEQFESIVASLTEKAANFQGFLAVAENARTQAFHNKNLADQLVQSALDLKNNSDIAIKEMVLADSKTKNLAANMKIVIDKLIYSAEVINKLSGNVVRKKALNPLISDELVSLLGTAGKDANNAVALLLVALKSTFAAQATNMEAESAIALENVQALDLYQLLLGPGFTAGDPKKKGGKEPVQSLHGLLHKAYSDAKANYTRIEKALSATTNQLNEAKTGLNKAQVKLKSLQSGLAAANAATLA